jgi:hypothetical protein
MYFLLQLCSSSLRNDMVAVTRMHCVVLVPMKDDGRDVTPVFQNRGHVAGHRSRRLTLPHRGECRWDVDRGPAGETGMHANRRIHVGISRSHDSGSGPSGRQSTDVNALRVDRIVAHDLVGDARDQRRLTLTAPLVARAKPVPTLRRVRLDGLCRIDDEASLLFSD